MNYARFYTGTTLVILFLLLIIPGIVLLSDHNNSFTPSIETPATPPDLLSIKDISCQSTTGVILNTFPVDLDLLFWADNLSMRNHKLNLIGNGTFGWMLSPFGGHFMTHMYGLDHWYCFTPERPLEVRAPHDGVFEGWIFFNESVRHVNETEVIKDVHLTIDIGQKCQITLGHLCLLKTIYDDIKAAGQYSFTEGELVGYTRPSNGTVTMSDTPQCDFWYLADSIPKCPYAYLNSTIQSKVTSLFNLEYERAKIAGVYPEAKLCNILEPDIEGTVWGAWQYQSGPFANIDPSEFFSLFGHGAGFVTFLNRSYWSEETFHKDWRNPAQNLTADVIGIVADNYEGDNFSEYNIYSRSLVKQVEGNATNGIVEIITTDIWNDWGFNVSLYARYSIDAKGSGIDDDLLTIEYFENVTAAQAGFTSASITYERVYQYEIAGGIPGFFAVGVLLALFLALPISQIPLKAEKKWVHSA